MGAVLFLILLVSPALASDGRVLFEAHCIKCHAPGSPKPLSFLKKKFKNNPQAVVNLAKRCPWGRGLTEMEIKTIAEWLAGKK